MADRILTLGGAVWADAAPDLPGGAPAEGTTYANSELEAATIVDGWPYATVVRSENFNEVMRRLTSLLGLLETYGTLPWCATIQYPVGALAMGSDGMIYRSTVSSLDKNPMTNPDYWASAITPEVPAGTVIYTAANAAPAGYLEANGDLVTRATYANLFAAIGTTYGAGDGATTFKLPDLRGEFIRGWDHGRGIDAGRALGSAQAPQSNSLPEFKTTTGAAVSNPGAVPDNGTYSPWALTGYGGSTAYNLAFRKSGAETRPRSIALMPCIKH